MPSCIFVKLIYSIMKDTWLLLVFQTTLRVFFPGLVVEIAQGRSHKATPHENNINTHRAIGILCFSQTSKKLYWGNNSNKNLFILLSWWWSFTNLSILSIFTLKCTQISLGCIVRYILRLKSLLNLHLIFLSVAHLGTFAKFQLSNVFFGPFTFKIYFLRSLCLQIIPHRESNPHYFLAVGINPTAEKEACVSYNTDLQIISPRESNPCYCLAVGHTTYSKRKPVCSFHAT